LKSSGPPRGTAAWLGARVLPLPGWRVPVPAPAGVRACARPGRT